MARPGAEVLITDSGPSRSSASDSGSWFIVGITQKGPQLPTHVGGMAEYKRKFGDRTAISSVMYDSADAFFAEGGNSLFVSRVMGPAAAPASATLVDGAAVPSLLVRANGDGVWGNDLNIAVEDGSAPGTFVLVVTSDANGELERSPDLPDKPSAFNWALTSEYITLTDQASADNPAVVAATSLAGGNDDAAGIGDADWSAALDRFAADLGPGQVSMPGRTTTQAHVDTLAHAEARGRIAILDGSDTSSDTTLITAASTVRSTAGSPANRHGALFTPWAVIPGIAAGTTRTIPYSAIQAGMIARVDASNGPDDPAAGALGHSRYAIGLSQAPWTEDQRTSLNDAGVNVARIINGDVVTYGYRTLADPINDDDWRNLAEVRLIMSIAWQLDLAGENYVERKVDGRGHTLSGFGGELVGVLIPYWTNDSLYGDTANEAFAVDVGPAVNTPESIASGLISASVGLRVSPTAEMVRINVTKKRITEAVA